MEEKIAKTPPPRIVLVGLADPASEAGLTALRQAGFLVERGQQLDLARGGTDLFILPEDQDEEGGQFCQELAEIGPVLVLGRLESSEALTYWLRQGAVDAMRPDAPPGEWVARVTACMTSEQRPRHHRTRLMHRHEQQRYELLRQLAGGLAHDLNNTLGSMLGNIALLKAHAPAAGEIRELLDKLNQSSQTATDVVADFLHFAQHSGNLAGHVDVAEALEELRLLLREGHNPLILNLAIPADLPPARLSPERFRQLLRNLCAALCRASGVRRALSASVAYAPLERPLGDQEVPPGQYLRLELRGDDPGDDSTRIGERPPVYQASQSFPGINAAIARQICRDSGLPWSEAHEHGREGTFTILLPCARQRTAAATPGLVLVVDDEAIVRQLLRDFFDLFGYHGLFASTAEEAMILLRDHSGQVALVLLDLALPGTSGRQLLAQIRELSPQLPILLLTGSQGLEGLDEAELPVAGIVRKPFRVNELSRRLRHLLHH